MDDQKVRWQSENEATIFWKSEHVDMVERTCSEQEE